MSYGVSLTLNAELIQDRLACKVLGMVSFLVLIIMGAYLRIPLPYTPVPITMQTFFVFLAGAVLGSRLGFLTLASYILLGTLGAPVFQGYGAGLAHLLGPTGGYIFGFLIAAWVIGWLQKRIKPNLLQILMSMLAGSFFIYLLGVAWLMVIMRIDLAWGLRLGFLPFIPGYIIKLIGASLLYTKISNRTREIFYL